MPRKPVRPLPAEPPAPEPTTSRTMADVLTLPDPLRQLAIWRLRQDAVSLEEVVAHLGQETEQARSLLDTLVVQGFAQVQNHDGVPRYRMSLLSRQRRQPARELWQTLGEKLKS
jgi:DNA-binding IclR family transcriptional regulator